MPQLSNLNLPQILMNYIILVMSLSIHEFAHAFVADRLGDDTPRRQGRLTLSPIPHMDLMGTLVVPLIFSLAGGGFFGWAKPVQVIPQRFTRRFSMRSGMQMVALAGPGSNLALALLAGLTLGISHLFFVGEFAELIRVIMSQAIMINALLCVFNLLPVPPLDGSRMLPRSMDDLKASIAPYSFLIILLLLRIPLVNTVLIGIPMGLISGAAYAIANGVLSIVG